MGSHMKKSIFEEQTAKALLKWREAARERRKHKGAGLEVPSGYTSGENTPSRESSPVHLLHKYKSSSADVESLSSSPALFYQLDNDVSDMEAPTFKWCAEYEPRTSDPKAKDENSANRDFTFG